MATRDPSLGDALGDAPGPARAFALVALVWLTVFVTQSTWPGDSGVAASFAAGLTLVAAYGCRRGAVSRPGLDFGSDASSQVPTRRRSADTRAVRRRTSPLRHCLSFAGWCALGVAIQPWLGVFAAAAFELVTGEVVELRVRPGLSAWRALSLFALAPVLEEALYRGHLFAALEQGGHRRVAVFATAAFFALPHTGRLGMFAVLLAGLVLGAIRAGTGRVAPCIATHLGFNVAASSQALEGLLPR
jgi:hypothetical protein